MFFSPSKQLTTPFQLWDHDWNQKMFSQHTIIHIYKSVCEYSACGSCPNSLDAASPVCDGQSASQEAFAEERSSGLSPCAEIPPPPTPNRWDIKMWVHEVTPVNSRGKSTVESSFSPWGNYWDYTDCRWIIPTARTIYYYFINLQDFWSFIPMDNWLWGVLS